MARFAGYMGPYIRPTIAVEAAFSMNEGTNQMKRCMEMAITGQWVKSSV